MVTLLKWIFRLTQHLNNNDYYLITVIVFAK
jgi:hypothetical protein